MNFQRQAANRQGVRTWHGQAAAVLWVVIAACPQADRKRPDSTTDTPSQSQETASEDTLEGEAGERCESSIACQPGLICAQLDDPQLDERPSWGLCTASCVDLAAANLRCIDDASCCRGRCTVAGVCELTRRQNQSGEPSRDR